MAMTDDSVFGDDITGDTDVTEECITFSPVTGRSIDWPFEDDIVTVEGVDSETEDATFTTISDPLYKKCEDFEP